MIITIDGPSGSGKSTVARKLAKTLTFLYINQGAFFRAVGLVAQTQDANLESEIEMTQLAKQINFSFSALDENKTGLLVNGVDRSEELLSAEAGRFASVVALHPQLRTYVLEIQQAEVRRVVAQGGPGGAVVEGRDAGSVGFRQAELKLYLDAQAFVRAKRRFAELGKLGCEQVYSVEEIAQQMRIRDERDRGRSVAPLMIPDGAVVIDTSNRSIDEVLEQIVTLVDEMSR